MGAVTNDLTIKVGVLGGAHIERVCEQMVELANRTGVSVEADLNGVKTVARPGVSASALYLTWSAESDSKHPHKFAMI